MTESITRLGIEERVGIAENVARISFEKAWRDQESGRGIKGIMGFGSTIAGKRYKKKEQGAEEDIDLLIIHDHPELVRFGVFSKSEELDENADITEDRYHPAEILNGMGSRFGYGHYVLEKVLGIDPQHAEEGYGRVYERFTNGDGVYGGEFSFPGIGRINIPKREFGNEREGRRYVEISFNEKARGVIWEELVIGNVESYLEERGFRIDQLLDLAVMREGLLFADRCQEERADILRQSKKDPTFWRTVLETGKLYNQETGKFDLGIEDRYKGAVGLFTP